MAAASCGGSSSDPVSDDAGFGDAQVGDATFDAARSDAGDADADGATNACPPHQVTCGGVCTDTRFDPNACGTCGNHCGPGEVCSNGTCASTCPSTEAACKDEDGGLHCADALTDNANCGYCGNVCAPGNVCSNGKCSLVCSGAETKCVAGDGTAFCTDLQTDPSSCGACGSTCPVGYNATSASCSAGKCVPTCSNGAVDCNGDPTDGCEVQPSYDHANCGGCGNICPVGASCTSGVCTCYSGYSQNVQACSGACTDLMRDSTNCGACGTRCSASSSNQSADCVESACHTSNRGVITTANVTSIAIDDTYVYYVQSGTGIRRVTKASVGETPVTLIADTTAYGIAVHAGTVFWTDSKGVYKCPVTGCVGAPKAVSDVPSSNSMIVADDTYVYWRTPSGLIECAQTGCNDAPVNLTSSPVFGMVVGGSSVFTITNSYSYPSYAYNLYAITPGDPPNTLFVYGTSTYGNSIAYDKGMVYFYRGGSLVSCDPRDSASCVPTNLATVPYNYSGGPIFADDASVLWVADGIHELNQATGVDAVIANIKSNASQLAADATNVYWAANDGVYWAAR